MSSKKNRENTTFWLISYTYLSWILNVYLPKYLLENNCGESFMTEKFFEQICIFQPNVRTVTSAHFGSIHRTQQVKIHPWNGSRQQFLKMMSFICSPAFANMQMRLEKKKSTRHCMSDQAIITHTHTTRSVRKMICSFSTWQKKHTRLFIFLQG